MTTAPPAAEPLLSDRPAFSQTRPRRAPSPEQTPTEGPNPSEPQPPRPGPETAGEASPQPGPDRAQPSSPLSPRELRRAKRRASRTRSSSPGSTNDPGGTDPLLVPPEDLSAALGQAADMGVILAGQAVGALHKRATGAASRDAQRWLPTTTERHLMTVPTQRIIRRHMVDAGVEAVDAIDLCLIGTGMAAFTLRSVLAIDPVFPSGARTPPPPPPPAPPAAASPGDTPS